MKTLFLPKTNAIILRISALLYIEILKKVTLLLGRNDLFIILVLTDLYKNMQEICFPRQGKKVAAKWEGLAVLSCR